MATESPVKQVLAKVSLDWSAPWHRADEALPCRVPTCRIPTFERDSAGEPCMQSCAEAELARERVGSTWAYIADERVPAPATTRGVTPR